MPVPIYISSVEIEGIRTFQTAKIKFNRPATGGQWIVLLGNNGAGKSTFLKAIAMALGEPDAITRFLEDARTGMNFVRTGRDSGGAKVQLESENLPFEVRLNSGPTDKINRSITRVGTRPFLVGYGSLRGTGENSASLNRRPADSLAPLFLPQAPLLDPQAWLQQNRLRSYETPNGGDFYQKVVDCVCGLLPNVANIEVTSASVDVLMEDGSRVPFVSLSDGYLTTAAWVLDMIAAWLDANPDAYLDPLPIAEQMTGIALIDEIDLHLHPIWQRQVVEQIRSSFPNMTFVATTHSPLTIMDSRPGELFVVDQTTMGSPSRIEAVDLRPGDVDDVLTGAWFNLRSTLDSETEQLMEEHRQLLSKNEPSDSPRRKGLEKEIRRRLDGFGTASTDHTVQSVANQLITDELRDVDAETRENARQKLLKLVKGQTAP
jgi:ABC-type transport system involved in cytochrome c biogenesis ATPase subunit